MAKDDDLDLLGPCFRASTREQSCEHSHEHREHEQHRRMVKEAPAPGRIAILDPHGTC